ncbi:helix-turn-helix domain-containing protein [Novosphingobium sp. MBES04]|uniref:helix-turn-helix domain-containing protein n=1 Tax=Novosphingobium sp. MBES04 TaxID=1206458 RepID=UPI00131EED24|nr:helix-turn-helix domain-containing protein [Novosphingobium sp. MBES04]
MSNHLTSEVYKRQVGNIARKAVMVLMADKASDDGSGIWASKQRMADEIGASKQTVISTIRALIEDGLLLEHGQRRCANGYTVEYAINVRALRALPFVKSHADDQSENLTGQIASPVKKTDPTGQNPLPHRSENLTQTTQEPSLNLSDASHPQGARITKPDRAPSRKSKTLAPAIPDWMPMEAWDGYVAMRDRIRKPMTDRAKELMIAKLDRWRADGHDPGAILDDATEHSWTGLYPPKEDRNAANRNNYGSRPSGRPEPDFSGPASGFARRAAAARSRESAGTPDGPDAGPARGDRGGALAPARTLL